MERGWCKNCTTTASPTVMLVLIPIFPVSLLQGRCSLIAAAAGRVNSIGLHRWGHVDK